MRNDDFDDLDEREGAGWAAGDDLGDGAVSPNGRLRRAERGEPLEPLAEATDDEVPAEGWAVTGGVVHWMAPREDDDPRAEAQSPLAADALILPGGAPDAPRVRAVRAWIARQRAEEAEALGALLLAQREQRLDEDAQPARRRGGRRGAPESAPLDLALAEHQAAADEYDTLLAALDDHAAHSGPGRALVEFYLWLVEYLATLAAGPEARSAEVPPRTLAAAKWRGRAHVALGVRGRVERVMAPSAEELNE
jgi:hypothetical protein